MCSYKMKLTNHEWDVIDAWVTYKMRKNCIILSIILRSGVLSTIEIERIFENNSYQLFHGKLIFQGV